MEMSYHGHRIQAVSREKPDSDRWDVEINVLYPEAIGDKIGDLKGHWTDSHRRLKRNPGE